MDDDAQIYLSDEGWGVLERLESAGFCRPQERFYLMRIAIGVAISRGLEVEESSVLKRETHYQRHTLDPDGAIRDLVNWRYPDEDRVYRRISFLAEAGCRFLKKNAQELDGNIPFIELVTEQVPVDVDLWASIGKIDSPTTR